MSKTIDLVIRVTVPVPDGTTPEDHCAEAWEEERPLLAVGVRLGAQVEDLLHVIMGASADTVQSVRLTLEPGREPGRPMTHAEAELFGAGVQAGMVLTMEASGLHDFVADDDPLTDMEDRLADYTGQDPEDYSEDVAARRLLQLVRCEWNGAHWITMTPGNEAAHQATLAAPKPWDHDDPWGIT